MLEWSPVEGSLELAAWGEGHRGADRDEHTVLVGEEWADPMVIELGDAYGVLDVGGDVSQVVAEGTG
jgi:hypothetical protein